MRGGAEVAATLFHDRSLKEATCEIAVRGAHEDEIAVSFANAICKALDQRGAVPIKETI
jgi:hypothetical protein